MKLIVEILDKSRHNFKSFDCGQKSMNDFLKQFALKNLKLNISRTWIVFDEHNNQGEKHNVIGYFTLSMQSVEPSLFPDEKLPRYNLPTTLLARIAIDQNFQNQGLGKKILYAALKKALIISKVGLPSYAVILDVLDEKALAFYKKFSFLKKLGKERKYR